MKYWHEVHEARRFDVGRRCYEIAAIRFQPGPNIGQGTIISDRPVAVMVMAGAGVAGNAIETSSP